VAEQALRLAAGARSPEAKHTYVRLAALWHGLADHLTVREVRTGQPDGVADLRDPDDESTKRRG
jgi:hypothetical protein